jgi:hypothetical protein
MYATDTGDAAPPAVAAVVPLVALAGLFVWLKLTEEADDEALDLERDMETTADAGSI